MDLVKDLKFVCPHCGKDIATRVDISESCPSSSVGANEEQEKNYNLQVDVKLLKS